MRMDQIGIVGMADQADVMTRFFQPYPQGNIRFNVPPASRSNDDDAHNLWFLFFYISFVDKLPFTGF